MHKVGTDIVDISRIRFLIDRYGDKFSTEVFWKEVISKISFDGVKWDDLKIDWKQRIKI